MIRTGNPDGGVEWYAVVGSGQEWGWQAKYIKGIDPLLTAMTDSVKRVAAERPNLTRLTFVISTNLSTGTEGRQRKSQRQTYDDKVASWKRAIEGADRIEFDLIQESDLVDRLSTPEHAGRRWFWGTPRSSVLTGFASASMSRRMQQASGIDLTSRSIFRLGGQPATSEPLARIEQAPGTKQAADHVATGLHHQPHRTRWPLPSADMPHPTSLSVRSAVAVRPAVP